MHKPHYDALFRIVPIYHLQMCAVDIDVVILRAPSFATLYHKIAPAAGELKEVSCAGDGSALTGG
jgi:hypothetical protein